ncbi:MAG: RelA/SpoT family protein [Patescibacteria group bacterium]|nr:RelA/SpoT family protein [Patescibacteria group bacterium]
MVDLENKFNQLKNKLFDRNFSKEDILLLEKAWEFAKLAHIGQKRDSGEWFLAHPLNTAIYLADWKMDITSIVSGILHDTIDWGGAKSEDLVQEFGHEIANLVQSVSRVSKAKVRGNDNEIFVENLRKMILAMAKDLRVVVIRMAERLDNLATLYALPVDRQVRFAKETIEIFAPLAERLGMGEIKGKLEDMAFPYLYKSEYERVLKESKPYYSNAEQHIKKIRHTLLRRLVENGIQAEVHARKKHLYSLWKKLNRPNINWDFEKIHDIVALRILVNTVADCYAALGIVHHTYRPIPDIGISDFIAQPKPNGYRSIHTKVLGPQGRFVEIQIRTFEMHEQAEYGAASHWAYSEAKSKGASDERLEKGLIKVDENKLRWVKQLAKWQEEISDSEEFLKAVKFDALSDRIFVFSPKGDVYDLPVGATPVDFAYAVHTDLGDYIKVAKVNNKIVPLNYKLSNSDVVEIIKHKNPVKPNNDWLSFVVTTTARRQIQKRLREK